MVRWDKTGRTVPCRLPNGYRRYLRSDVEALLAAPTAARQASA